MIASSTQLSRYANARPQVRSVPLQPAVALTVAYEFESFEHCEQTYAHAVRSDGYSRISNPTVRALEERLARRSGALEGVAFASGMATICAVVLSFARAGSNIVSSPELYGGTVALHRLLAGFGIEVRYVSFHNLTEVRAAIDAKTAMLFAETISNPAMRMYPYEGAYRLAQATGVLFVLDNTNTYGLFRGLEYSDIEVVSCTKYVGGQGAAVGGIALCGPFVAAQERYPWLHEVSGDFGPRSAATFAQDAVLGAVLRNSALRNLGGCMSPMNAFLFTLGEETLDMRMAAVSSSSRRLAEFLTHHDGVAWVNHPLLLPENERWLAHFPHGTGGLLTFGLRAPHLVPLFLNTLRVIKVATNIGDSKTIVQHAASTSHGQCTEDDLVRAKVSADMLRISVGLEPCEVLLDDLDQALRSL